MTNTNSQTDFELCLGAVFFHIGDFFMAVAETITGRKLRS
ncbi:hypothetical protein LAV_00038 [Sphingobium phage Lacusarx]|uniref:Uncharacterized protein n=1 Tax=Sphingobium phage Lacusarx TaxID=1980139 RepID=A0A1W6DWZ7_9CAUD|nr:hypothetical protein FDH44_gp038 [Sphingobium phage Lacusarx]ARK07438.1 hypothetical protein LAV_00038 [Sphingobium phage Lacusarx]